MQPRDLLLQVIETVAQGSAAYLSHALLLQTYSRAECSQQPCPAYGSAADSACRGRGGWVGGPPGLTAWQAF